MYPINVILQNKAKHTQKDFGRDLQPTGVGVTQDSNQTTYNESSSSIWRILSNLVLFKMNWVFLNFLLWQNMHNIKSIVLAMFHCTVQRLRPFTLLCSLPAACPQSFAIAPTAE